MKGNDQAQEALAMLPDVLAGELANAEIELGGQYGLSMRMMGSRYAHIANQPGSIPGCVDANLGPIPLMSETCYWVWGKSQALKTALGSL